MRKKLAWLFCLVIVGLALFGSWKAGEAHRRAGRPAHEMRVPAQAVPDQDWRQVFLHNQGRRLRVGKLPVLRREMEEREC